MAENVCKKIVKIIFCKAWLNSICDKSFKLKICWKMEKLFLSFVKKESCYTMKKRPKDYVKYYIYASLDQLICG